MRLSSEAGTTALLSAVAGFFISQCKLFSAADVMDSFRAAWALWLYVALFASAPLAATAFIKSVEKKSVPWGGILFSISFVTAFTIIIGKLASLKNTGERSLEVVFLDKYSAPLLFLPVIWVLIHLIDFVSEIWERK